MKLHKHVYKSLSLVAILSQVNPILFKIHIILSVCRLSKWFMLQVFWPELCTLYFSSLPYMQHTYLITFTSLHNFLQPSVTSHLLSPHFLLNTCSQITPAYILPLLWETRIYNHTKQCAKLFFWKCILYIGRQQMGEQNILEILNWMVASIRWIRHVPFFFFFLMKAVLIFQIMIICVVTPCSRVGKYEHFGWICCLCPHVKICRMRNYLTGQACCKEMVIQVHGRGQRISSLIKGHRHCEQESSRLP
jgi:hypothetical protein